MSGMLDWKIRKGAIDDQKVLHTGADSQSHEMIFQELANMWVIPEGVN